LLAGLLVGYWVHDFPEPSRISEPAPAQLASPARVPNKAVPGPALNAIDLNGLILEATENRWSDEAQARLRSGIESLSLAEIQPALDGLKGVSDFRERSSLFKQIMRRWAQLEPRVAFDYLNAMGEGEIKSRAMTEVARILARTDPGYLASAAEVMPANRAQRELVQELTKAWSETDVRAALTWAERLPEHLSKQDALAIIRFTWANQNP